MAEIYDGHKNHLPLENTSKRAPQSHITYLDPIGRIWTAYALVRTSEEELTRIPQPLTTRGLKRICSLSLVVGSQPRSRVPSYALELELEGIPLDPSNQINRGGSATSLVIIVSSVQPAWHNDSGGTARVSLACCKPGFCNFGLAESLLASSQAGQAGRTGRSSRSGMSPAEWLLRK